MNPPCLSPPQWAMLLELSEPNANAEGEWYFPRSKLRTLISLANLGYVRAVESDPANNRYGYTLTLPGKERFKQELSERRQRHADNLRAIDAIGESHSFPFDGLFVKDKR